MSQTDEAVQLLGLVNYKSAPFYIPRNISTTQMSQMHTRENRRRDACLRRHQDMRAELLFRRWRVQDLRGDITDERCRLFIMKRDRTPDFGIHEQTDLVEL